MRSIVAGVIMLSASTSVAATAQAEKHTYAQALINHREPVQTNQGNIGVDPVHSNEDALTKRIEQDKIRLDRVIEICPSC
jgi:hypothetical protein